MWRTPALALLVAALAGAALSEGLGLDVLSTVAGNHTLPFPVNGTGGAEQPWSSPCEDTADPSVFYFVGGAAGSPALYVGTKNATHLLSAARTGLNGTSSGGQVACGYGSVAVSFHPSAENVTRFCAVPLDLSETGAARAVVSGTDCAELSSVRNSRLVVVPGPVNTATRTQYLLVTKTNAGAGETAYSRLIEVGPDGNIATHDAVISLGGVDGQHHLFDGEPAGPLCFSPDGRFMAYGSRGVNDPTLRTVVVKERFSPSDPSFTFAGLFFSDDLAHRCPPYNDLCEVPEVWLAADDDRPPLGCTFALGAGSTLASSSRHLVVLRQNNGTSLRRGLFSFPDFNRVTLESTLHNLEFFEGQDHVGTDTDEDPVDESTEFRLCQPSLTGYTTLCVGRSLEKALLVVADMTSSQAYPHGIDGFAPLRLVLPGEVLASDGEGTSWLPTIMPLADGGAFVIGPTGYARVFTNDVPPEAAGFTVETDLEAGTVTLTADLSLSEATANRSGLLASCFNVSLGAHPFYRVLAVGTVNGTYPALADVAGAPRGSVSVTLNLTESQVGAGPAWLECGFYFDDPEYAFSFQPVRGARTVGVPFFWPDNDPGAPEALRGNRSFRGETAANASVAVTATPSAERAQLFLTNKEFYEPFADYVIWNVSLLFVATPPNIIRFYYEHFREGAEFEPVHLGNESLAPFEALAGPDYWVSWMPTLGRYYLQGNRGRLTLTTVNDGLGVLNQTYASYANVTADPERTLHARPQRAGFTGDSASDQVYYPDTTDEGEEFLYTASWLSYSLVVTHADSSSRKLRPSGDPVDYGWQYWASTDQEWPVAGGVSEDNRLSCVKSGNYHISCGYVRDIFGRVMRDAWVSSSSIGSVADSWPRLALPLPPLAIAAPRGRHVFHVLTATHIHVVVPRNHALKWQGYHGGATDIVQTVEAPAMCQGGVRAKLVYGRDYRSLYVVCGTTVTRYACQSNFGRLAEDPDASVTFEGDERIADVQVVRATPTRDYMFVLVRASMGTSDRLHKLMLDGETEPPVLLSPADGDEFLLGEVTNLTFSLPEAASELRLAWQPASDPEGPTEYIELEVPANMTSVSHEIGPLRPWEAQTYSVDVPVYSGDPLLTSGNGLLRVEYRDNAHLLAGGDPNGWGASAWANVTITSECPFGVNLDPRTNCTRCDPRFAMPPEGGFTACALCASGLFSDAETEMEEWCRLGADECRETRCDGAGDCTYDPDTNEFTTVWRCECDSDGDGYLFFGATCNDTRAQCRESRCGGLGLCQSQLSGCWCDADFGIGLTVKPNCTVVCDPGTFGEECELTAAQCRNSRCNGMGNCTERLAGCACTEPGVTGVVCDTCPGGRVLTGSAAPYSCANCDAGLYGADCTEEEPVCVGANLTGCDTCTNLTGVGFNLATDEPVDCRCYTALNTTGNECSSLCGDFEGAEPDPDDPRVCLCPEGRIHSTLPEHRTLQCAKLCASGTFNALTDECECLSGFYGGTCQFEGVPPPDAPRPGSARVTEGFTYGMAAFGSFCVAALFALPKLLEARARRTE